MANMSNTSGGVNWNMVLGGGVILAVFAAFSLPSLIVFAVGLLPTFVAYLIDSSDQKFGAFCVGGLNMCGVFPYVLKLWNENHTPAAAVDVITDVFTLFIMFTAAGFGWMIFLAIPPVIASFLSVMAQTRVKTLRTIQKEIMEEWGPEVASTVDDEPVGMPPGE